MGTNPFRYRGYYWDEEIKLYYLNARYYDPEVGRFISQDGVSYLLKKKINGLNLFSYCFNNPVNIDDQNGNFPQWIKSAVKWVVKDVVKPVVKCVQSILEKIDITYSTGVNISGSPSIFSFNLQGGISIDSKGNIALQGSFSGGFSTGSPSLSITGYQSITNAPNVNKLNGPSYQIGASAGVPIYGVPVAVGGDFNIIPDTDDEDVYYGLTTNVGIAASTGVEAHVEWGETATLLQFNIFDIADNIYTKIMEW